MSQTLVEVCIDNIESLYTATRAGANRVELCSALTLGGLTPSLGLIQCAIASSQLPIYVMIRPREGDFIFNQEEIVSMEHEIRAYKDMGVDGVVIGALNPDATINKSALDRWVTAAEGIGVTFHRAFDLVSEPHVALNTLIEYSVERILTSGMHTSAIEGIETIKSLVEQADNKLAIMAGAGVNAANAHQLVNIGVKELHLSGKIMRPSTMLRSSSYVSMGSGSTDDAVSVADFNKIKEVVRLFNNDQ